MPSAALQAWATSRTERIDRLREAHAAYGRGRGRRWKTEELNHALVLRLASEFQGFTRDLHNESVIFIARTVAPTPAIEVVLRIPYTANRKLDYGNAGPGNLGTDFALLGVQIWADLRTHYPVRAPEWSKKLEALNTARNGIAHDDASKRAKVKGDGWPMTLSSVDLWKSALDGLAKGMDRVVGEYLESMFGVPPW